MSAVVLLASFFLTLLPGMVNAQTRSDLPSSIQASLDEDYPGWFFPGSDPDYIELLKRVGMYPNLVFGDYDGDNSKDYALRIAYEDQARMLVFLGGGQGLIAYVIKSYPDVSYFRWTYLFPHKKGDREYD